MGKKIIIIDECINCPYIEIRTIPKLSPDYICKKEMKEVSSTSIPKWCGLNSIPELKPYYTVSGDEKIYNGAWNDCLNFIGGQEWNFQLR